LAASLTPSLEAFALREARSGPPLRLGKRRAEVFCSLLRLVSCRNTVLALGMTPRVKDSPRGLFP
jgi:hypothetical protein